MRREHPWRSSLLDPFPPPPTPFHPFPLSLSVSFHISDVLFSITPIWRPHVQRNGCRRTAVPPSSCCKAARGGKLALDPPDKCSIPFSSSRGQLHGLHSLWSDNFRWKANDRARARCHTLFLYRGKTPCAPLYTASTRFPGEWTIETYVSVITWRDS